MKKMLIAVGVLLISTTIVMADVWQVRTVKNEFAGTSFTRIHTEYLSLNRPLEFPYQDLRAIAVVDCDDSGKDVFGLRFTQDPNLTNYTLQRLGNEIHKRVAVQVKLDGGDIKTFTAYNKAGSPWLTFGEMHDSPAILASKKVMLQMDFYKGTRHITIDMSKRQKCQTQLTKK